MRAECTHKGFWGECTPRKMFDFRPSKISSAASSEYRARIQRIMQTTRLALEAYIKRDVDYCDRECGVLQDRLRNSKS